MKSKPSTSFQAYLAQTAQILRKEAKQSSLRGRTVNSQPPNQQSLAKSVREMARFLGGMSKGNKSS